MTTTQFVRHTVSLTKGTTISSHTITRFQTVLIVDCETTLDFAQSLRLAGYCLYSVDNAKILEKGLIIGSLDQAELDTLVMYANSHQLNIYQRNEFITGVVYPQLEQGTTLVNHNIPFDLGCLATAWSTDETTFYLKLCSCPGETCPTHPSIAVRSLNFPKALLYVSDESRAYGAILDTMTIGRALLGPGDMSLKGMGTRFKCETVKQISDEHGDTLTADYLDYTMRDVQATLELFLAEMREYHRHGLQVPISFILSEAGIGKAYFKALGIPPFIPTHHEIPQWVYPTAHRAYYGARSEVKIRLQPTEIRYCDFKSQYPTVNALLGLQALILAETVKVEHRLPGVQSFLNRITLKDLQRPTTWKKLSGVFVKLAPDGDILPTKFETVEPKGKKLSGYAVCEVTGPNNWYALCDVVASKLLAGKTPKLIDAIVLYPQGQIATDKLNLFGDERYSIDLTKQDFFTEVINLRTSVKAALEEAKEAGDTDQVHYLDSLQLALKLLANSTSYGVFAETRIDKGIEQAGTYYASPIAASITSGARLLLAIAERLGRDRGLTYAMCDTDSMAYARPDTMNREHFYSLVDEIVRWFDPLSPYADKAALFELEEVNYYKKQDTPLYFLGVSCKRYALYNRLEDGTYRLRKISAHATGAYQFDKVLPLPGIHPPSEDCTFVEIADEETGTIPAQTVKGKMYQYILWYRAIQLAETGIDPYVPVEPWSTQVVRMQESISKPSKLKRYSYLPGIRPFSFFTITPSTPGLPHRYVMPYQPTHAQIMAVEPYIVGTKYIDLDPYYDTLAARFHDFFTHSEAKAANGDEIGLLTRRSLQVTELQAKTRSGKKVNPSQDDVQPELWDLLA